MGKRYVVTGEYITTAIPDPIMGTPVVQGYYRNALLPESMTAASIEHHLSTGQIKAVQIDADGNLTEHEDVRQTDPAEAKVVDGLGEPNMLGAVATGNTSTTGGATAEVKAGDSVDEPKKTDDKAAWVDYAVSKGADRKDIEEKNPTKADLIATWGTPK